MKLDIFFIYVREYVYVSPGGSGGSKPANKMHPMATLHINRVATTMVAPYLLMIPCYNLPVG